MPASNRWTLQQGHIPRESAQVSYTFFRKMPIYLFLPNEERLMVYKLDWIVPNLEDMQEFCRVNQLFESALALEVATEAVRSEIGETGNEISGHCGQVRRDTSLN